MGFRFRRSARLGPLRFNFSKGGLLALIETPEALEGYLLRAQSQDDAKRRGQRCIAAAQQALQLAAARGWLNARSDGAVGGGPLPAIPNR
jgi:hypothetical protein